MELKSTELLKVLQRAHEKELHEDDLRSRLSLPHAVDATRKNTMNLEQRSRIYQQIIQTQGLLAHADYDGEEYVRSLTELDKETVNEKFGQYLTGNVFNAKQQEFVKVVIGYVRENGEITREDLVNAFPFNFMHPVQLFGDKLPLLLDVITTLEQLIPTAA